MCYTVPIAASVITTAIWCKKREPKLWSLNLMLYGAALFGFIDHLWNKELFIVSENIISDLCLGLVITLGVFIAWRITLAIPKKNKTVRA